MAILFFVLLQTASAAGAPECTLDVTRVRTIRKGPDAWEYRHAEWKKHPTLGVNSSEITVADLSSLGLLRRSHACRRLYMKMSFAECLKQKVRLTYLHFNPTSSEVTRHAHASMTDASIRDRLTADLADRRRLLSTVVRDNAEVPTVYHYVYGAEFMSWLDLEESAGHGPTRFAARTWVAHAMRDLGVTGAVMIGGRLPDRVGPVAEGPVRHKHYDRDVVENGPAVLFFQPARR